MDTTLTNDFGTFTLDVQGDRKVFSVMQRHEYMDELSELLKLIAPSDVVVDIGAHIGSLTIPLARRASVVHAFEPSPTTFQYLKKNIAQNNVNVVAYEVALGAQNTEVAITERDGTSRASNTIVEGTGVQMRTLDSYHLAPTLIKIDVEGYEPEVLQGAQETIRTHRPAVHFEVNLLELRRHTRFPLFRITQLLPNYWLYVDGKRIYSLWLTSFLIQPKFFLFNRGGTTFNVLALPVNVAAGR